MGQKGAIAMQNRFSSPVVWAALAAQVLAILVTLGVLDLSQSDAVNAAVTAALELLVVFGLLNNPTNRDAF